MRTLLELARDLGACITWAALGGGLVRWDEPPEVLDA